MADFAPPAGPPPPKVPEGWKAVWNDQYSEWFYVNIYTKKSQWDKPTGPVYPSGEAPLDGPPPYGHGGGDSKHTTGAEKGGAGNLSSNNPYASSGHGSAHDITEDERLARQLQEEENARAAQAHGHSPLPGAGGDDRGAADSFYNQHPPGGPSQEYGYGGQQHQTPYDQQAYPAEQSAEKGKKGGFLGKLLSKASGSRPHGAPHSQQYGAPGYAPQGYGQPHYGAAPAGYYGGGYPPQQAGRRPGGGGLGMGGAAALGVGGGLVGGMLLADAADAGDGGGDYGGDGGDYGGDGGGDFGGGDGGGDFGGGDF